MAMTDAQIGDVEMKNVDSPVEETKPIEKKDTDTSVIQDIRENVRQIEKGVTTKEARFITRILRTLSTIRKRINVNVLTSIINGFYTHSISERDILLTFLVSGDQQPMEVDGQVLAAAPQQRMRKNLTAQLTMEVDAYLNLLIILYLLDSKRYKEAQACSDILSLKLQLITRRTLDLVAVKCYYYFMRSYELTGELEKIRPYFHFKLRSATLRNDFEGQAVLINCLLRNYLHFNLYDQADKLISKSVFPETASNNEWAKFLYYLGRIKAARLEYSAAHTNLVQALRKAPQTSAVGFRQAVQKLAVTVELLLGDIPDRVIFRQASLRRSLDPYFQLTQAVRMGNLQLFAEVLNKFGDKFEKDHTYALIIRLRHNVIKTAVRAIAASYSRISPAVIAKKLGLDSPKDAECIIAKAIRDGVIEATLDPTNGYMQTKESVDIYCTAEPQIAFHQRTAFCLELHNSSVKAMRYPPKSYGKDLESAEERREREQQDLELAKEMAEDEDDAFP